MNYIAILSLENGQSKVMYSRPGDDFEAFQQRCLDRDREMKYATYFRSEIVWQ